MAAINQEHGKFDAGPGNTIARISKGSSHFEIIVNMEDALKVKSGESDYLLIEGDTIFTDVKKGNRASNAELETAFGTTDIDAIGKEIVKKGDVLIDQAHRTAEQEQKIKQIIDFLATNAIDPQSGRPISQERIKSGIEEVHINVKNSPIENQIQEIIEKLARIMPIKIETRKIKVTVPAIHTGKAYGVISQYKERENWLNDGSLEAFLNIPAGILIDFYDKLNSVTHGSALAEEIKE
jgi:ribosome maturation protein SDO1